MTINNQRFVTRNGLDNNSNSIANIGVTGASLTQVGANSLTLTTTGTSNVTFPASGTLAITTGNIATATSIAGGAANGVPYQTGAGVTAFLAQGTGVLAETAGAPAWTTTPTLTGTNFTGIPNGGLTNSSTTINGTSIALGASGTVTAAAGTLTGTTLNATVVSSSLTSVGTIATGVWNGTAIANANLANSQVTIGSTAVSLGATVTTFAGLTSVTSTGFTGALTGAASSNVLKAGDTMTGLLVLSADPSAALGAATKQYVDKVAAGLATHTACETATTVASNLGANTYTAGVAGGSPDAGTGVGAYLQGTPASAVLGTIGGYAGAIVGTRILVKDQSSNIQNGIYVVTLLGDGVSTPWKLTRSADYDNSVYGEVKAGALVYVSEGTNAGTQWVQTSVGTQLPGDCTKIGTDAIAISQFAGAGTYTQGSGISISSNVIANTGVLSNVAGTGISVSGATGNVTVTNTGVTSAVAGTNISVSGATGAVTIAVTGTVPTATTATNLASGAANSLPYQTGAGATAFLAQGTGVLAETAGAPSWTTTPTLTGTNFTGIPNGGLTNSSVTVGTTAIALGASATTIAGLVSVTSTGFTGALTGNASTATSIAAGTANQVPYQTGAGATSFYSAANYGVHTYGATGTPASVAGAAGVLQGSASAIPAFTTTPTLTGTNFTGIGNGALTNSSVTVNGTAIALGASGTVTAAAGTLTGTTLNATVVTSSLTSVGTLASLTSSGVITGTSYITSASATVAAAGTTQGTATALTSDFNVVTSGTGGVVLAAATPGRVMTVVNKSGVSINVYPSVGHQIDTAGTNGAVVLINNGLIEVFCTASTQWYSTQDAIITGTFVNGAVGSATNIAAGTANQVPYQTDAGATSFYSAANYGVHTYGATGVPASVAGAAGVLQGSASAIPAFTTTPTLTGTNFTGIPNGALTNSSTTINGTAIALGASGTVTAAAGTLTGTTLNATVTGSSLTSVGTIATGTWSGSFGAVSGANLTSLTGANVSGAVGSATNIAAGLANQIPYQTGAGATTFYAAANYGVHTYGATGTPASVAGAAGVLQGSASAIPAFTTTPTLTGTNFTGIPNGALTNSSTTIGTTAIALGSSSLTLAGLTSVAAGTFTGALSGNATTATTATNLAVGASGSLPYQSSAGATAMLAAGTTAQVLISGTTPSWTAINGLAVSSASTATTATNIAAGTANQIPYQTGAGATTFYSAANYGVQTYGATGVPAAVAGAAGVLQGSASAIPAFTTTPTLTGTNFTGIPNGGLTNSSVTVTAGTGMSGGGAVSLGGTVTLTNAGVTSAVAGTAISVSGATGAVTITNTGVTSIAGTTNQITLSAATGGVTVSLPTAVTISGTMTAGAFNATSTKRVKKAIKDLSKTYLAKFDDLRPREYDRKDYVGHEFGFVAEEMALVYPEIVGHDDKGQPSGIDYGRLSAILTAKVQDQQSTIDKLKEQMTMVMEMLKGSK